MRRLPVETETSCTNIQEADVGMGARYIKFANVWQVGLEEVVSYFSLVKVVMADIGRPPSLSQWMSPSRRQKRNLASPRVAGGVVQSEHWYAIPSR